MAGIGAFIDFVFILLHVIKLLKRLLQDDFSFLGHLMAVRSLCLGMAFDLIICRRMKHILILWTISLKIFCK